MEGGSVITGGLLLRGMMVRGDRQVTSAYEHGRRLARNRTTEKVMQQSQKVRRVYEGQQLQKRATWRQLLLRLCCC